MSRLEQRALTAWRVSSELCEAQCVDWVHADLAEV